MKHKIRKAVLPVAGFGTRFLPATKAQPKEMLPLVDKPVIQYLVEEAVASGIEEIIIITGRGKRAIEDHFDYSYELEETLVERGQNALLKEVRKISDMARFVYVRQPRPLGDGHAILCARDLLGDEPFAVLFGDDIIDSRTPALKQLMEVYEDTGAPVVALTTVSRQEISHYGIAKIEQRARLPLKGGSGRLCRTEGATRAPTKNMDGHCHRIIELVEKPSPRNAPSNLAIIGKYIITPEVLDSLAEVKPGQDGEVRLIDGLKKALKKVPLYGLEIEGKRYDCGDKLGFLKATIHFALQRKDIGPALKKHLKSLDFK